MSQQFSQTRTGGGLEQLDADAPFSRQRLRWDRVKQAKADIDAGILDDHAIVAARLEGCLDRILDDIPAR